MRIHVSHLSLDRAEGWAEDIGRLNFWWNYKAFVRGREVLFKSGQIGHRRMRSPIGVQKLGSRLSNRKVEH